MSTNVRPGLWRYIVDGEYRLALPKAQAFELKVLEPQAMQAVPAGWQGQHPSLTYSVAVVRLGLIGGGSTPATALRLVDALLASPFEQLWELTRTILRHTVFGDVPTTLAPSHQERLSA